LRILLAGKYPPTEGGVSGATFRAAHDLATAGHHVEVVTNCNEVEVGFREFLWGADESRLQLKTAAGSVSVLETRPLALHSYVPWTNPYVSKVAGRALAATRVHEYDAIVGVYLEPYGVAAALISTVIEKPLILRHAGSDIGRLSEHPDLQETYRWALSRARIVLTGVTKGHAYERLLELGASPNQVRSLGACALPGWFSESNEVLNVMELADAFNASSWPSQLFGRNFNEIVRVNAKRIRSDCPTIGTYGKVGVTKGSFALIEALQKLAAKGYPFNFVTLAGGTPEVLERYCATILECPFLRDRSWILPLIAPWRIPPFLRACKIVAFLEHNFPIVAHRPGIPREVLSVGTCLVCSSEIADKQGFRCNLVNGKNYVRINVPDDSDVLSAKLSELISDQDRCHSIGRHGMFLSKVIEEGLPKIDPIVELIEGIV
jgi:glycosyltransferase involved in cell wall biosynthesis